MAASTRNYKFEDMEEVPREATPSLDLSAFKVEKLLKTEES